MQQLLAMLPGTNERVGFVLKSGEIVEVENICTKPTEGFDVSVDDLLRYEDEIEATWHTHPGGNKNLSVNDHEHFLLWPHVLHFIVAPDGVQGYAVENGRVVRHG